MGRKNDATIRELDESGHNFTSDYDLYFNDCTNKRCRFSHDRAACIRYFYAHTQEWFDYAVHAITVSRIPTYFIYSHFRPIVTHDPDLMNTIARYNRRPCYSVMDGVRCRNPKCKGCHDKRAITMYYVYHPDVYISDLLYKIGKLNERGQLQQNLSQIRADYLSMLEQFAKYNIRPANAVSITDCKVQDDDVMVMKIINTITTTNVREFVEATNRYTLENPTKIVGIINTICKESASFVANFPKMLEVYYAYVNGLHHSTVFASKLQYFVDTTITYLNIEWDKRYEQLKGHSIIDDLPDENLAQRELSNIIAYELMYTSGPIYDVGVCKLQEVILGCNKDENMILAPYVIKFSEHIPKSILRVLFEKSTSLPASSFKSKLRFALMDALDI